jgi:hypothetical protein
MSISLDKSLQASPIAERALNLLKGKDNPFEVLARPQQADDTFADAHVPEFQQSERDQLLEMIDTYRLPEYQDREGLRPCRVVTVRGDRGSGKTHLLQSLVARPDGKPQVIVRPAGINAKIPFEEYLLFQLKSALGQQDEFHADRPIDVMAKGLTRLLLRQALRSAGPTDRLNAVDGQVSGRLRFLWGGGERVLHRLDQLLSQLADPALSHDLPGLVSAHSLAPASACRLVEGHLQAFEVATELQVTLRKLLYQALTRSVFLRDDLAIPEFLNDGYRQADPTCAAERSELVLALLQALVEAAALVRMPVVFAFDNLERLLSSDGTASVELTRCLVDGIAQAVDTSRGMYFLVFAESTLFEKQLGPVVSETFARPRWEQGVALEGRGPVFLVDLKPPSDQDVQVLIRARIHPLLTNIPELKELPQDFPFRPEFIGALVGTGTVNLRNVLYQLRDEFNRVVYEKRSLLVPDRIIEPVIGPQPLPPTVLDWNRHLETAWTKGLASARRNFDSVTQHDLHDGLCRLLNAGSPVSVPGWSLNQVEDSIPVGENPDYGVVSVLDWRAAEGRSTEQRGPQGLRVAIGFLLASGPGMAPDLRAKFDFLRDKERGVRLLILWPTQREAENLADCLPPGTRKAWENEEANHWRTALRRIDDIDLRRILVFQSLLMEVQEIAQVSPPGDILHTFVHQKMGKLFPMFSPPQGPAQKG